MTTMHPVTGNLALILGNVHLTLVTLETNVKAPAALVDLDANEVFLPGPGRMDQEGTLVSATVIATGSAGTNLTDPSTLRYTLTAYYQDGAGRDGRWVLANFPVTSALDISDAVATTDPPASVANAYLDQMQALIDQAGEITGLTGEAEAVAYLIANPSVVQDAVDARVAAAPAPESAIPYLVGVPMWIYGDSYTQIDPPEATPGPRVAARNRMLTPVNRGVSGSRFHQIYERIVATWTPNTRGLVVVGDGTINNIQVYPATTAGYATAREAFRALLAYLSDRDVRDAADGSGAVTRFSTSWTDTGDGYTAGVGAHVDVAWDSAECDVFLAFTTDAGGTIEFRDTTGSVVATVATGGYSEPITGVVSIPSQGVGAHTVRGTVTAGTVTVRKIGARAATPPVIVWDKAGPIPFGGASVGTAQLRASQAQELVAAQAFDNVVVADNDVPEWDMNTMIGADTSHRTDQGQTFAAETMQTALDTAVTGFAQGLNAVELYTADAAYTPPVPSYAGPGAAVPAAPVVTVDTAFQFALSWTRPTDNGATLTGYRIESSPAGAGTWTLHATINNPAQQTYTAISGFTPGANYDFRIRATNSVGFSSWSATVTAQAGALPTFYSRDDFARDNNAETLGDAVVGGTWAPYNAVFGTVDDRAVQTGGKDNPAAWSRATVDDGQSGGYCTIRISKHDLVACGIVMNVDSDTAPTLGIALVSYQPTGDYRMIVQISATDWVVVAAYPVPPQDGDEIGIYHDGVNYYPVINGTVQDVYVGSTDLPGTRHGPISYTTGAEWDDYSHTNIDPR